MDKYEESVERRISVESRLVKLEGEVMNIKTDISETKLCLAKISNAMDNIADGFLEAKTAFSTCVKIIGWGLTGIVMTISVWYYVHNIITPVPVTMSNLNK